MGVSRVVISYRCGNDSSPEESALSIPQNKTATQASDRKRLMVLIGMARFELATSRTPSERATRLRHIPCRLVSTEISLWSNEAREGWTTGSTTTRAGLRLVGFEENEEVAQLFAEAAKRDAAVVRELGFGLLWARRPLGIIVGRGRRARRLFDGGRVRRRELRRGRDAVRVSAAHLRRHDLELARAAQLVRQTLLRAGD